MWHRLVTIIVMVSIVLFLSACQTPPASSQTLFESPLIDTNSPDPTVQPAQSTKPVEKMAVNPTITPDEDSDPFLVNCNGDPESDLPFISSPNQYQGWYRYTNELYGFTLAFPSNWNLIAGQNFICIWPQSEPTINLVVGFKRDAENVAIQRSGIPAGEVKMDRKVKFFDQEINKSILTYQEKDKAILYHNATEIQVSDLFFTLSVDDYRDEYNLAELATGFQSTTDAIVESFDLTK